MNSILSESVYFCQVDIRLSHFERWPLMACGVVGVQYCRRASFCCCLVVTVELHNRNLYKHDLPTNPLAQHAHASTSPRTEDSDEARAKDRKVVCQARYDPFFFFIIYWFLIDSITSTCLTASNHIHLVKQPSKWHHQQERPVTNGRYNARLDNFK